MSDIYVVTIGSPETTDYDHICQHLDALQVNAKDNKVTICVPRMGGAAEPLFLLQSTEREYELLSEEYKPEYVHEIFDKIRFLSSTDEHSSMIGYVGFGTGELVQEIYQYALTHNIKARKIND